MPPVTRSRARLNPDEEPQDNRPVNIDNMDHTGASQLITPAMLKEKLAILNKTHVDNNPLNTEKTIAMKVSMCRSLARRFLRANGTANPKPKDVDSFDLRRLFSKRPRAKTFLDMMHEQYPNENTFNTYLGYWSSIFNACKYKTFGLNKTDVHEILLASRKASKKVSKKRETNAVPANMEDKRHLTWQIFVDAEKSLRNSEYASADHVAFALRILLCPRRDDDFARLRWTETAPQSDAWNYCVIPPRGEGRIHLVFQAYKTSKAYGKQIIYLDNDSIYSEIRPDLPELGEILATAYNNLSGTDKRGFVLETSTESVSNSTVAASMRLKSIAARKIQDGNIGIRALRRIYSSWSNAQNWTVAQKRNSAYIMGHSLEEAQRYVLQGWEDATRGDDTTEAQPAQPEPTAPSRLVEAVTKVIAILQEAIQ